MHAAMHRLHERVRARASEAVHAQSANSLPPTHRERALERDAVSSLHASRATPPSHATLPLHAMQHLIGAYPAADLTSHKAAYAAAATSVRAMLTTTTAYVRPTRSREAHPFVQRDFPEIRRDKFAPGVVLSKEEFMHKACMRAPPLAEADLRAAAALDGDLALAMDHIAMRGPAIVRDREARLKALRGVAASLEPLRRLLDAHKCATAKQIASRFNVAWAACVVDAMQWPDVLLPLRYMHGFDVVFDIPDSGVFRADEQPAELPKQDFVAANTRVVAHTAREIERSALQGSAEDRERRKQCWKRTCEEIDEGLVSQPRTRAQMDRRYGRGKWRCLGRNAIKQKGKWRCIDNGKRSKHNRATAMHERITCGRADFPVTISREFAKRRATSVYMRHAPSRGIKKRRSMRHGTNDLRAAYRHVPTSQPEYTCVAVWDDDQARVVYCDVPGHNFGLKSAVVNFNRFPELGTVAARRLLWVVSEHYYDDNDTCEPAFAGDSGQQCLVTLFSDEFFGFPFDPAKDVPMDEENEYLGVVSSLARVEEGVLVMDVSKKRRAKLRELIREVRRADELRSGLASSIFGKGRFMLSPCYGAVGKACLEPIMRREHQPRRSDITPELDDSLEFVEFVCDHLPAAELPVLPATRKAVIIFTDAEGKKRRGPRLPSGHIGFVVCHPVYGKCYASGRVPDALVRLLDEVKERETYIGQFELVAAIAPFVSLPAEWLAGYPVELWIDNAGAIGALVKGYSGVPDCARIVNMFHFAVAKLGLASLRIDYVPTESNPADIPSRLHEMNEQEAFEAVCGLGELTKMVIPSFATSDGQWRSSVEIAASVWG